MTNDGGGADEEARGSARRGRALYRADTTMRWRWLTVRWRDGHAAEAAWATDA